MTGISAPTEGEIILYRTATGEARIEVMYQGETFWLSQKRMADQFGVDLRTVSHHLNAIYASGELEQAATIQESWRVQTQGNRDVSRSIRLYNLDAIISVGYRVNSAQATQFRIWATRTLREFMGRIAPPLSARSATARQPPYPTTRQPRHRPCPTRCYPLT